MRVPTRRRVRPAPRKKSKYTAASEDAWGGPQGLDGPPGAPEPGAARPGPGPLPLSPFGPEGGEGREGPKGPEVPPSPFASFGADVSSLEEEAWTVFTALKGPLRPSGPSGPRAPCPSGPKGKRGKGALWGAYVEEGNVLQARRKGLALRVENAQRAGHAPRAWRSAWQPLYARLPWEEFLLRLRRHWLQWATGRTPSGARAPDRGPSTRGAWGTLGSTVEARRRAMWDRLGAVWAFKGEAQARRWVVLHRQGGGLAFLQEVARQVRAWEGLAARQAEARKRRWRAQRQAWREGMVAMVQLHRLLTAKVHWRRWSHAHRLRRHAARLRDRGRTGRRARARRVALSPFGPLSPLSPLSPFGAEGGEEEEGKEGPEGGEGREGGARGPKGKGPRGPGRALVPLSPVLAGGMAAQDVTWDAWQPLLGDPTDGAWRTARPRRREGYGKAWTFFRGPEPTHAWGQDGARLPLWAEVAPWDPTGARNPEAGPGGGRSPWAFFTPEGRGRTRRNGAVPRALGPVRPLLASRLLQGSKEAKGERGEGAAFGVPNVEVRGPRRGEDLTPWRFRVPQAVAQDPRLRRALALLGLRDRNWGVILRRWRYRRAMMEVPGDPHAGDRLKWPLDDEALPADGGEWNV